MKKKIFRANWLIYPQFQLRLIAINTFIVSVGFALVTLGLHEFFSQLQKTGSDSGLNPNHYYFVFLGNQSARLYWLLTLAWLSSVVICALISLLLSHKIVGPIVRLRSYMNSIASSDARQPLRFRDGDFFSDLPAAVNGALEKIGAVSADKSEGSGKKVG